MQRRRSQKTSSGMSLFWTRTDYLGHLSPTGQAFTFVFEFLLGPVYNGKSLQKGEGQWRTYANTEFGHE